VSGKLRETPEPEMGYLQIQAYLGTTKHMGGFSTTQELIERCGINRKGSVLEVGCGAGATACYLANEYGCQVMGVDLREAMVALANERAAREGVQELVGFRVADAKSLPFDDAAFDVVFCESVLTFVEDKQGAVDELARVTKHGGCVGLNEEIWLKPPPADLKRRAQALWGIEPDILAVEDWLDFLRNAGLHDVEHTVYNVDARREATQLKRYRFRDMWRMFYRMLVLALRSPAFRRYLKTRKRLPKDAFTYLGYALFVAHKSRSGPSQVRPAVSGS
jgi:SAM-dependent methyltransferase